MFIDNLLIGVFGKMRNPLSLSILRRFYADCAGYPRLRHGLARNQEYIGAMSDEELRRVI